MRWRDRAPAWSLLALMLAAGGCAKFTFIEKGAERRDYTRVAPVYEVSDGPRKASSANAATLVIQAANRYRAGDLAQAGELARQALRADKGSADAHNVLALVADARGDARTAGQHYQAAATAAPQAGVHLGNYGAWLCGNDRVAESLPWFERALADPADPNRADTLANAGRCGLRAGQPQQAEIRLRSALQLAPEHPVGLATMAELAYGAGRDMEARAFSERRLAAAPPDRDALQLAARIEERLGDAAAAARYRAALTRLPSDPSARPSP